MVLHSLEIKLTVLVIETLANLSEGNERGVLYYGDTCTDTVLQVQHWMI